MNRRERLARIVESYGGTWGDQWAFHRNTVLSRRGIDAFSDEILAEIVYEMVSSHKRQQRYNREARERRAKAAS